jgi:catechol 2,3-dioxygenase-like lactoylglutathione lyase family enzyme
LHIQEAVVLSDYPTYPTLPASDLARARKFYEESLGFKPVLVSEGGVMYGARGTTLFVYPSSFAGTNQATAAGFQVEDLAARVAELKARGVRFEEYDFPGFKTESGVMSTPDGKAAWFKDSEGNIVGLFQRG